MREGDVSERRRIRRNGRMGRRQSLLFKDAFRLFDDRHVGPFLRAETRRKYRNYYKNHLKRWERRRVATLTRWDIQALHEEIGIAAGQTTANRVVQLLSSLYNYLIEHGYFVGPNPTEKLKRFREKSRRRFLTGPELHEFFTKLKELRSVDAQDIIMVCLTTGARISNVLSMRWKEIDFDDLIWTVPAVNTKTGEDYLIPLVSHCIVVLERRKESAKSIFVFPAKSKSGHMENIHKSWSRLLNEAGIENLRLHDLRRSMGSWEAKTGASLPIIGRSLNHTDPRATAIYARLEAETARDAMQKAMDELMRRAESV